MKKAVFQATSPRSAQWVLGFPALCARGVKLQLPLSIPVKDFLNSHLCISTTRRGTSDFSSAIDRATVARSKSDEKSGVPLLVIEVFIIFV